MLLCNFKIGINEPLFLIAGPCVIESESLAVETAGYLKEITDELNINFIYKSSFDKANRSSVNSFRGLGLSKAIDIFSKIKKQINVKIITDIHTQYGLDNLVKVVDILQIPAFLCRQTDLIKKACSYGCPVNIKKGQFLSPWDMQQVIIKAKSTGNNNIMVSERGTCFGYNNLVSDMRSLTIMSKFKVPIIYDVTHSVQIPGGNLTSSSGNREFIPSLSSAAVAVGISGIFIETHPNPDKALSDGPNSWPIKQMKPLLKKLKAIDSLVKFNKID